ncbi:MAG: hypothetical protein J3K34DRAFT_154705 [Monoraphidium minutum]|nr:MAG: hypothetical protein J3K34DRAFT_154705 [Monoraphidium minutum]
MQKTQVSTSLDAEGPSDGPKTCTSLMPGCVACASTRNAAAAGRKLMGDAAGAALAASKNKDQGSGAMAASIGDKEKKIMAQFQGGSYRQPMFYKCLECNATEGYKLNHALGRCECIPGFGSLKEDATCDYCPSGSISVGGFKAKCVECGELAWPNEFSAECMCISGTYGKVNSLNGQAMCAMCPDYMPVSLEGSTSVKNCTACGVNKEPSEDLSMCVIKGTGMSGLSFSSSKETNDKWDTLDALQRVNYTAPDGWQELARKNNMSTADMRVDWNKTRVRQRVYDVSHLMRACGVTRRAGRGACVACCQRPRRPPASDPSNLVAPPSPGPHLHQALHSQPAASHASPNLGPLKHL